MKIPLSTGCLRCFDTHLILLLASLFSSSFQPNASSLSISSSLPMTPVSLDPRQPERFPLKDCTELWDVSSWAHCLWVKSWSWSLLCFRSVFLLFTKCAPRDLQAGSPTECTVPAQTLTPWHCTLCKIWRQQQSQQRFTDYHKNVFQQKLRILLCGAKGKGWEKGED